jgi:hypothetical protein
LFAIAHAFHLGVPPTSSTNGNTDLRNSAIALRKRITSGSSGHAVMYASTQLRKNL